jgi:hypothetical protein
MSHLIDYAGLALVMAIYGAIVLILCRSMPLSGRHPDQYPED